MGGTSCYGSYVRDLPPVGKVTCGSPVTGAQNVACCTKAHTKTSVAQLCCREHGNHGANNAQADLIRYLPNRIFLRRYIRMHVWRVSRAPHCLRLALFCLLAHRVCCLPLQCWYIRACIALRPWVRQPAKCVGRSSRHREIKMEKYVGLGTAVYSFFKVSCVLFSSMLHASCDNSIHQSFSESIELNNREKIKAGAYSRILHAAWNREA